jgi:5,10-methylenetetrahydromethanopterin reductase
MTLLTNQPGLMLSGEMSPGEFIEAVKLAESSGYSELWYTDQRFWRDCYSGLTLAAQHTENLLLGPGVNDPYTRHPATIAMAIATLDELSGGRAQLGLGIGGSGIREMRIPKDRPVRALREGIELIRRMLVEPEVQYDGEIFHLDQGRLGFQPVRSSIPVFVATHSPQTLRLSGRMADGVLLGNMARPEAIRDARAHIHEGERRAGRIVGDCKINLRLETLISDDAEPAIHRMKLRFAARMLSSFPRWEYLDRLGVEPTPDIRAAAERGDREAVARHLSLADIQSNMLVGSRAQVVEQLIPLMNQDLYRITIRPYAIDQGSIMTTISEFGDYVWPKVSQLANAEVAQEGRT